MKLIRTRSKCLTALLPLFAFGAAPVAAAPLPPPPAVAHPIAVRAIVVANFEVGKDTGDAPGEFQLWAEREHLDEAIPVRGVLHPLRRNAAGLYGIVWDGTGTLLGDPGEQLMALVLDPRFDFSHTYWLFTGISGVDPAVASVGSAAWARWVVQADTMREFDDREKPKDWPYGLFAIGATRPNTLPKDAASFGGESGDAAGLSMAAPLNGGLAAWAYRLTSTVTIPDTPALREARAAWTGYPNAQRPPFVLMGETLGTFRYWHGAMRTQWARDWVKLWTSGQGRFAMSNMESQALMGALLVAAREKLVDPRRVLVLRTASNPTMPPPGHLATDTVGDEGPGQMAAFEANYRVGAPVLHELLAHWERYSDTIPTAPSP